MKSIIALSLIAVIGIIPLSYASSDFGDCEKHENRIVYMFEWKTITTYDCTWIGFDFSISQSGLTEQEVKILDEIKESRKNGTYKLDPIDTTCYKSNPMC